MQVPLRDLMPHWLDRGPRAGMGVRFQCPCQHDHELHAWFLNPADQGDPDAPAGQPLFQYDGATFEDLSLYPPIQCGDCLIVVYEGKVNVIYLD